MLANSIIIDSEYNDDGRWDTIDNQIDYDKALAALKFKIEQVIQYGKACHKTWCKTALTKI